MIITWFFAMPAQAGFPDPEPVPGQSVGADLMVNMVLEGAQVEPDIALRPDGSLIVVWRQGSGGIRGRLIDRSGTPLGADFNVSDEGIRPKVGVTDTGFVVIIDMTTYIAFVLLDANGNDIGGEGLNVTFPSNSINPDLARLADGSFVVVWTASSSPHDNSDYSIRARALSSAGQPVGDEIGINLVTAGRQEFAAVAASKSSGFLVVWQSGNEIRSRRFTSLGGASGEDILVATSNDSTPHPAVTETPSGEYLVAWEDSGLEEKIRMRRVDAAGTPYGPIESLAAFPSARTPTIGTARRGDGLVAWSVGSKIFAQRISPAGSPLGEEFRLDVLGSYDERNSPRITADADGGFFVTWFDYDCCAGPGATDVGDVWLKRYPGGEGDFTEGLVAYWSFDDGTVEDLFGDVEDTGTLLAVTPWNSGRFGRAINIDLGEWVSFNSSTDLEVSGNEVSVACWIRLQKYPSEFLETKVAIWDGVNDNYVLFLDRDDESIRFEVTNASGQNASVRIPQEKIKLYGWQHLTGVYDGNAGQLRIYLDGGLVNRAVLSGNIRSSLSQLPAIGRNGSEDSEEASQYYFDGQIDDMAIWNRALKIPEIESLARQRIMADGFEGPGQ